MKKLKSIFFSLAFALIAGVMIAPAVGAAILPIAGAISLVSFVPTGTTNAAMAGIYREVWTGEMVKNFKHDATFLERIPDQSRYVNNDVIHLVDVGAHPDVLIDNTTYPLTPQDLGDNDIAISLAKFETVPTSITSDELYTISYNKMQAAIDLHREALEMETGDKAAHAIAPSGDTAATPVIVTTGEDNGDGFKRITMKDLALLKKKFDDAKLPKKGRVLILSTQHVQDLLLVSNTFEKQYSDTKEGLITRLYGFDIYEYINLPVYDGTLLTKKAYGAASAGTDRIASVAFVASEVFKAKGSIEAFLSEAKKDVLNKRNLLSYNLRFVVLPKKARAIGAVINDTVV